MEKNNLMKALTFIAVLLVTSSGVAATQIGMNYYHESMMRSGGHYIDRTPEQVAADMDDIKGMTDHVKLYANPFYDENIEWVYQVNSIAKAKGMHTVIVMNTEDRQLDDSNWQDYRNRVLNAAGRFNGQADEFIVGNEMKLHSAWSPQQIKDRVAPLIDEAKGRFSGPVSYEALYWEREPWLDYPGTVYINMYEHYDSFETNLRETSGRMGSRLIIGEFGELTDGGDGWPVRGEAAQADDVGKRWDAIKGTATPVAYVFTYREPSYETGFGLVRSDGSKKETWNRLGGSRAVKAEQVRAEARAETPKAAAKRAQASWSIQEETSNGYRITETPKKVSAKELKMAKAKAAREAKAAKMKAAKEAKAKARAERSAARQAARQAKAQPAPSYRMEILG